MFRILPPCTLPGNLFTVSKNMGFLKLAMNGKLSWSSEVSWCAARICIRPQLFQIFRISGKHDNSISAGWRGGGIKGRLIKQSNWSYFLCMKLIKCFTKWLINLPLIFLSPTEKDYSEPVDDRVVYNTKLQRVVKTNVLFKVLSRTICLQWPWVSYSNSKHFIHKKWIKGRGVKNRRVQNPSA